MSSSGDTASMLQQTIAATNTRTSRWQTTRKTLRTLAKTMASSVLRAHQLPISFGALLFRPVPSQAADVRSFTRALSFRCPNGRNRWAAHWSATVGPQQRGRRLVEPGRPVCWAERHGCSQVDTGLRAAAGLAERAPRGPARGLNRTNAEASFEAHGRPGPLIVHR